MVGYAVQHITLNIQSFPLPYLFSFIVFRKYEIFIHRNIRTDNSKTVILAVGRSVNGIIYSI